MQALDDFQKFAVETWFSSPVHPAVKLLKDARKWVGDDVAYKAPEQQTVELYLGYVEHLLSAIASAITAIEEHEKFIVPLLGLTGESGEVAEKFKKVYRGDDVDINAAAVELGDVLFYTSIVADRMGLKLSEVAKLEQNKIYGRIERGTQRGSGDNR